jgi:hypothetical protein
MREAVLGVCADVLCARRRVIVEDFNSAIGLD